MDKLLVVEDEKLIRQGIIKMIQRSEVPIGEIIECNNGEKAWEILQEQSIDVVFTDIRMPKLDGISLVQNMQQLKKKPLTVVISGYDDFSYAVEMLRMGVMEYILKPIDREQIFSIMEKLEKAVQKNKETMQVQKILGIQQLKYLCIASDMDSKEKEILENQFRDQFFTSEYVVCCCNCTMEEEETPQEGLYIGNVDEYQVFVAENDKLELLLKNELVDCYVGISNPVKGIENLQEAYKQAEKMRKQTFVTGNRLLAYGECENAQGVDTLLNEEQQKQLDIAVHMLGTEHIADVIKLLESLARDVKTGRTSVEIFESQMKYLLEQTAKNYEHMLLVQEDDILLLQNMYQYQTLQEYLGVIQEWVVKFNQLISAEFDDYKNKQRIQQAIGYIRENYQKDLNMAVVSNVVSMNYSLFSYSFKLYTGKNFVTYLKELRIQEAKRLLEKTDMRIIEISQAVGYGNEKHFMKTFKAFCGVSPTEYRKNASMKN